MSNLSDFGQASAHLAKIKSYAPHLENVKDQTVEMCLIAVNINGHTLRYVKNQTPEICMAAVQQNGYALEHVDNNIPEKIDPNNPDHQAYYNLGWRDGDLERVRIAAVNKDINVLLSIRQQSPELCLSALKNHVWAIIYVNDLEAIAHLIDEEIVQRGLKLVNPPEKKAYEIVLKIREANAIANRVNNQVNQVNIKRNRVKL